MTTTSVITTAENLTGARPDVGAPAWSTQVGYSGHIGNVTSYSGAAFDYATKTMHIVVAGGHGDSWMNQCFAIQIPSGTWTMTKDQTPFPPDDLTKDPNYQPLHRYKANPIEGQPDISPGDPDVTGNGYDFRQSGYPVQ